MQLKHVVRVLLVEDDDSFRNPLQEYLTRSGYEVVPAADAEAALDILLRQRFAAVVLDVGLPGMSGVEAIAPLRQIDPDVPILMLTGMAEVDTAVTSMRSGVSDYLVKPLPPGEVIAALERALRQWRETRSERREAQALREEVVRLTLELREQRERIEDVSVATLDSLVHLMEEKNNFLSGHSKRVAQLAATVAAAMDRSDDEVESVRLAGRLHDIGMICVADEIPAQQRPLTPEEFEQIKRHPLVGAQIVGRLPQLGRVAEFIARHHEQWDGNGYPGGLAGDAIPWGAQLIGAAEIYDALTTTRPYRSPMAPEAAVEEIRKLAGTKVSPSAAEALGTVVRRGGVLVFVDEHDGTAY